jgi:hypothetical protein
MKSILDLLDKADGIIKDHPEYASRTVMPYGFGIKVSAIIDNARGFEQMTSDSISLCYDELAGLVRILEAWIENEKNSVWVEYNGKKLFVPVEFAELIKEGKLNG